MKKTYLLLIALSALIVSSCEKDEDPVYELSVTVNNPDTYDSEVVEGAWVYAEETGSGRKDSALTDANGMAVIRGLAAGIYNVSVSKIQTGVAQVIVFSAVENNVSVLADVQMNLDLTGTHLGGLVFKEVYFSGSRTLADKPYFADQYYEIYNNSTDVIYADKLCIGVVNAWTSKATISPWIAAYPEKQSIESFWFIPGSGTDHPINPGECIIIAQDGIDHQSDPLGNPNSPVNLGDADFETFVFRDDGRDVDVPSVPNMELGYATRTGIDWLTSVFGCGYILFRIDGDIPAYVAANRATRPESTIATEYILIDNSMIVDAFQAYRDDSETSMPKLHPVNDAGFTFDPNGNYTGKCVRRKVKTVINGRTVYQDTNNSTNDFLNDQECAPRVN